MLLSVRFFFIYVNAFPPAFEKQRVGVGNWERRLFASYLLKRFVFLGADIIK